MKPSTIKSIKFYGIFFSILLILSGSGLFLWQIIERKSDWPWNYWANFLPYSLDLPLPHRATPQVPKSSKVIVFADGISSQLAQELKIQFEQNSQLSNYQMEVVAMKGFSYSRAIQWMVDLLKRETAPAYVILLLGGEEWFEQKFSSDEWEIQKETWMKAFDVKNFLLWKMDAPWAEKYLPTPPYRWHLQKEILSLSTQNHDDLFFHQRKIMNSFLLKLELQTLFQMFRSQKIPAVVLNSPLNPLIAPKKKCRYGIQTDVSLLWKEQKELNQKKSWEESLKTNDIILKTDPFNPLTYFQRGKILWKNGANWEEAIKYIEIASILDCKDWRGNGLFNQIIESQTKVFGLKFFDWSKFLMELTFNDPKKINTEIWSDETNTDAEAVKSVAEILVSFLNHDLKR
ncbi:MAG: hypothetical protein QE271_12160 [Bacteriovoracaceae bacterium]|nr:hypothetical protein [Bacteriovoracaceae bacterium]